MAVLLSPGVDIGEVNFNSYATNLASTIVGMVGGARKGPLTPTLLTSRNQLISIFGEPSENDYGVHSALAALSRVGSLYYQRVVTATAQYATAGADTDMLTFKTQTYDSTANGLTVTYTVPDANGEFKITILNGAQVLERHLVSTKLDAYNFVEDSMAKHSFLNATFNGNVTPPSAPVTVTLGGGVDSLGDIKASDIVGSGLTGLKAFENPETFDINVLAAPGWGDAGVINEGLRICSDRGDCLFIGDTPIGLTPQDVVDWANGEGTYADSHSAFDNSFGALYWPWLKVADPYSSKEIWLPPSGFVIAQIGYTDTVAEPWFAPAGLQRGKILGVLDVEYSVSRPERDLLYGDTNIVNPIVSFKGNGLTIWGQKTMQRRPLPTSRVNVRRLVCLAKKLVAASSLYVVFEQNDPFTWDQWKGMIKPVFDNIKTHHGVYDYQVIMDSTTVSPADQDAYRMPGKIMIKATRTAEFIPLDFVLLPTGADFTATLN